MSQRHKDLEASRVDTAVSIAKGILGAIPYGGALFAEIINVTVPNQRLDRITKFLVELDRRLDGLERELLGSNQHTLDLLEDALIQASRALSEQRNRYIASFLKRAVNVDGISYETKKKLLHLLEELTDRDVEILRTISRSYQLAAQEGRAEFVSEAGYRRLDEKKRYEYDARHVSWSLHIGTLERLGLVEAERERQDLDLGLRHIDEDTGLPKTIGYKLSKLGRVFLDSIAE
jgi:hypothetical protein